MNSSPKQESPAKEEVNATDALKGNNTESKADNHEAEVTVSATLMELLLMNKLPVPEPGIFGGTPLEFTAWKRTYNALIEHRGILAGERFYFLLEVFKRRTKGVSARIFNDRR